MKTKEIVFSWMVSALALMGAAGTTEKVQRALDVVYAGEGWKSLPVCTTAYDVGVNTTIVTHPASTNEPTGFVRMVKIADKNRWLNLSVSSMKRGEELFDWVFVAKVNGEVVRREVICTEKPKDIKIPLGAWAGQEVKLELLSAAGGKEPWCYEYAYWHQIRIDEEYHPDWVKDLVIYEIATKSFNSPKGPEQGTFKSVQEKLPYLQQLGINAIWLTGSDLADPHHFYNIWTQYASIRPDRLDPSLGTHADLQALTAEAHARGIRIFFDVITHGVMNGSSLTKEHPEWFKGGSWGMTDYNWGAHLPALDEWWVQTFTDYVLKDGVDGFRLDCGAQGRYDLWREIKRRVWAGGREIAVLPEGAQLSDGVGDTCQTWRYISLVKGRTVKGIQKGDHVWNVGKYYGTTLFDDLDNWNRRRPAGTASSLMVPSIEISCHDNGWNGFPADQNPYPMNGSRAIMGYAAMLAPAIPVMMMGEEFDPDYVPVPGHCGELFGKDKKTPGRWLYGSWLQWSQLEKPRHRAMLEDTTRMLALRKRYAKLVYARTTPVPGESICEVPPKELPTGVPVPYIVFNRQQALLVAGNPTDAEITLELTLPAETLGRKIQSLKDVWGGSDSTLRPDADGKVKITIPKDRIPRGGLAVYELFH